MPLTFDYTVPISFRIISALFCIEWVQRFLCSLYRVTLWLTVTLLFLPFASLCRQNCPFYLGRLSNTQVASHFHYTYNRSPQYNAPVPSWFLTYDSFFCALHAVLFPFPSLLPLTDKDYRASMTSKDWHNRIGQYYSGSLWGRTDIKPMREYLISCVTSAYLLGGKTWLDSILDSCIADGTSVRDYIRAFPDRFIELEKILIHSRL